MPGSYASKEVQHLIALRQKGGGGVIHEKKVALANNETYPLSDLFQRVYDFDTYVELRGGIYIPKEGGFKNTYKIDLDAKYFTYYPTEHLEINLVGGISLIPGIEAKQTTNNYPNGSITSNSSIDIYSLVNSFVLSFSPVMLNNKSQFQVGGYIAVNYANLDRTLSGTGAYTSVSGLSNNDSTFYLGYGLTGSYMYNFHKNLDFVLNVGYSVNQPEFEIKYGFTSNNYQNKDAEYDMSGYFVGIGIKYNF